MLVRKKKLPLQPSLRRTAPLYWAYGSNLNIVQMQRRCPTADPVDKLMVPNKRLVFRGVADVPGVASLVVAGGLWRITADDEAAMDIYEGYNPRNPKTGLYRKRYMWLPLRNGKKVRCLYYQMNREGIMAPSKHYLAGIVQGYKDFVLPLELLEAAVAHSRAEELRTDWLAQRHVRKGEPELATGLPLEE